MRVDKEAWLKALEIGERAVGNLRVDKPDGTVCCCALGWGLMNLPPHEQAWESAKNYSRMPWMTKGEKLLAWKYWVNDIKQSTVSMHGPAAVALDISLDDATKIVDLSDSIGLGAAADYIRSNL